MSNKSLIAELRRQIEVKDAQNSALKTELKAANSRIFDLQAGMLQVRQVSRHLLYGGI